MPPSWSGSSSAPALEREIHAERWPNPRAHLPSAPRGHRGLHPWTSRGPDTPPGVAFRARQGPRWQALLVNARGTASPGALSTGNWCICGRSQRSWRKGRPGLCPCTVRPRPTRSTAGCPPGRCRTCAALCPRLCPCRPSGRPSGHSLPSPGSSTWIAFEAPAAADGAPLASCGGPPRPGKALRPCSLAITFLWMRKP